MLIDWFTTIAQVINFLILVLLLKRFLYRPVIQAMDRREAQIAGRLQEAERAQEEANQRTALMEDRRREMESRREDMIRQAGREAEELKRELMRQARREVAGLQRGWEQGLEREQERFIRELKKKLGREFVKACRRILTELAGSELEGEIVKVFLSRLKQFGETQGKVLSEALDQARGEALVNSSFPIKADQRKKLESFLAHFGGPQTRISYQISRSLTCGVELKIHSREIAWSVDDYLVRMEEALLEELLREAPQSSSQDVPSLPGESGEKRVP